MWKSVVVSRSIPVRRCSRAAPGSPRAKSAIASCCDAAISAYRKALALQPDSPELFLQIGIALHKSGQSAKAEVVWKRAFAMRPTDGALYAAVARPLALLPDATLRNPKRAVELATKARELSPDSGEVWTSLALAQYSAQDYDAALESLWRSMALRDGGDGSDWLLMAMVNARLDRIDESRRWYDKATAWMGNRSQREEEMLLLRAESEELLKIKKPDKK